MAKHKASQKVEAQPKHIIDVGVAYYFYQG